MGNRIFSKAVEINGAVVILRSLDGVSWSSNLKDLRRLRAERREVLKSTQKAFRTIGINDRWGLERKRRRAGE